MRASIASNAPDLSRRMLARAVRIPGALAGAARELAGRLEAESKRRLQAGVYSVPVPRRKTTRGTGAPAWTRTRDLIDSERAFARGADVVMQNDSDHAIHRARLGTPGGRPIKSPGVRVVQWQRDAARAMQGEALAIRHRGLLRALRG